MPKQARDFAAYLRDRALSSRRLRSSGRSPGRYVERRQTSSSCSRRLQHSGCAYPSSSAPLAAAFDNVINSKLQAGFRTSLTGGRRVDTKVCRSAGCAVAGHSPAARARGALSIACPVSVRE
jgi:hypothetical protein